MGFSTIFREARFHKDQLKWKTIVKTALPCDLAIAQKLTSGALSFQFHVPCCDVKTVPKHNLAQGRRTGTLRADGTPKSRMGLSRGDPPEAIPEYVRRARVAREFLSDVWIHCFEVRAPESQNVNKWKRSWSGELVGDFGARRRSQSMGFELRWCQLS